MSFEPKRRDRSAAANLAKEEAHFAKLSQDRKRSRQRITALKAGARKKDRQAESRDKVLIGIAALAAVKQDSSLAYSIDTKIGSLDRSARTHLGRDGSLWLQAMKEAAKVSPQPQQQVTTAEEVAVPVIQDSLGSDPDLAPIVVEPSPKPFWKWYQTWEDHEDLMRALGLVQHRDIWLSRTFTQQKALETFGKFPISEYEGMSSRDIVDYWASQTETLIKEERAERAEKARIDAIEQEQARAAKALKRKLQRDAKRSSDNIQT